MVEELTIVDNETEVEETTIASTEELGQQVEIKYVAPVEEEEDFDSYFDDAPVTPKAANDNLDDYIEDEYYDEPAGEYDLSEALRDITSRYNELDFTTNDHMSEKLKLIRDIENLIENENSKGEGIYSDNEDIRQIFTDLQDVVDDMKNAL
mgnify:CR=1 FL=1